MNGKFDTEQEAIEARRCAELKYFGEFANKNSFLILINNSKPYAKTFRNNPE